MIGFKTEFGLRKNSGRIALTRPNLSQGQPEVTQLILNPIVTTLLYSLARTGRLSSYSPTLESTGFYKVELFGSYLVPPELGSGLLISGSV